MSGRNLTGTAGTLVDPLDRFVAGHRRLDALVARAARLAYLETGLAPEPRRIVDLAHAFAETEGEEPPDPEAIRAQATAVVSRFAY